MSASDGATGDEAGSEPTRSGQAFTGRFDAITARILPSSLVTHVHLLRHGTVQGMEQRIVRGQLDEPLSSAGRAESAALARWFARNEPRPDRIVSSDLVRCRELAGLVARESGAPLELDPRLREQSMGRWEGLTWAEITAAEPENVRAYWNDYFHVQPSGGESFQELTLRVATFWNELLAQHAGERIVVVTHIGVIRVLLCELLGVPGEDALRFAPAVASHTALQLGEAGAVLNALGERPWRFEGAREPTTIAPGPSVAARDASGVRAPLPRADERGAASTRASATHRVPVRIALSGSAGTGKTTLGRRLADALGVPYLEERMRRRLEQGFDPSRLGHGEWRELMEEDWAAQRAAEDAAVHGFVADRSSIDFAAFWLHYGLHDDRETTERWMARRFADSQHYDRIVLCPWGGPPIVDDGVRSTNRWAQLRYQTTLEGLLERFCDAQRILRMPLDADLERRTELVLAHLAQTS
ncbi:MAG: histidine phosphatase family protein [Planctomycetes bacterium]|nr:histidine phosphatase family protein [Planctomycetota bacterium]